MIKDVKITSNEVNKPQPQYIKAYGIYYRNELNSIKKSSCQLQPIFEAFINAWDAIREKYTSLYLSLGNIDICFYYRGDMYESDQGKKDLLNVTVSDNGIGFERNGFERLVNLRDGSKSARNKGTGRIQFLHFFEHTEFYSVYKEKDEFHSISMTMSKNEAFLNNNAILRKEDETICETNKTGTTVNLKELYSDKDKEYYRKMDGIDIKKAILVHYLSLLCEHKDNLPTITIKFFLDNVESNSWMIRSSDLPNYDRTENITVKYSQLAQNKKIVHTTREEEFQIISFIKTDAIIQENAIYFVSNGALAQKLQVDGLSYSDNIEGNRYLFLVKSNYFDKIDDDLRGNLHFVKKKEFRRTNEDNLFPEECLLFEDIKDEIYSKVHTMYPELTEKHQEALQNLEELQRMFLLDEKSVDSFRKKIKVSDSDEDILKAIYTSDIDNEAERDAMLKKQLDRMKSLSPDESEYTTILDDCVSEITKTIPLQNRTSLTKYVAHRKMVLEMFEMILNKELQKIENGGRINEALLHNLIFQQHSEDTSHSDIWIIDDQYLYFEGCSEKQFNQIEYKGEKLFKEKLTDEEMEYKEKNGKDIGTRRPDILLYPEEGKCLIIEFKAPDVAVEEHLNQINRYASMINNLSKDKFHFNAYYGYLIGENIDYLSIEDNDSSFVNGHSLGYVFRPHYRVPARFNKAEGHLYTEILSYSYLLHRAKERNKIFIEKLGIK